MKTTFKLTIILAVLSVLFFACQKETSFEIGSTKGSVGSLQTDGAGGCLGAIVFGTYYKDSALNSTHYANVNVNVDTAGSYIITTDTVQGYYFNASGIFSSTGTQVIKLAGKGKPLSAGTHIFTLHFNGTVCDFSVTVIAGTGGSSAFTVNCLTAVVNGSYVTGTATTAANTVVLNTNVTTIGTWSISTSPAVNGIIFSGSGSFTATGAQTITLTAGGIPTASGTFSFPVSISGGSCNFQVTCNNPADYFPRTTNSNWSYEYDNNFNDSLLIKVIPQTKVVLGNTYNIFMVTDNASLGFDTLGYYRRSGPDYFEWLDAGAVLPLDQPVWMEYIFLKDNLTVGGTWNSASFSGTYTPTGGTPVPLTLRWDFSIVQQNASVVVKGVTYPNTIQVKQDLKQLVSGNWVSVGFFNCYYSRDKGLIKQDLFNQAGVLQWQLEVRRLVVY